MKKIIQWFKEEFGGLPVLIFGIGTALLGIFADSIAESYFPPLFQKNNVPLVAFAVSSVAFVASAIISISAQRRHSKYSESIDKKIGSLTNKLELNVTYIPIGKGNKDQLFHNFRKMIEKAESEIFILTYHVIREINSDTPPYLTDARRAYYQAMADKMMLKNRKKYRFRRIIQIPEGREISNLNDPIFFEHMRKLAEIGETHPEFSSLKKCKPYTENTYIMIDRRFLISQIAVLDPNEGGAYYDGYFVIEDPSGLIMKELLALFNRIDARSVLVKQEELRGQ